MDTARSQHKLTTLDATVDSPQEWCDSPEGSDMDSTPTGVPRVTKPPHVQSTPRSLLDTFSLEMDSSLSEAELSIQGIDKNQSLSDAWESITTGSTGNILDSGTGRHIYNMVNLTDKVSIKRLRGFNGTLEHTSGKGYKPIKVSIDAGDELHWDVKDMDYFPAATTERSMCKLSSKNLPSNDCLWDDEHLSASTLSRSPTEMPSSLPDSLLPLATAGIADLDLKPTTLVTEIGTAVDVSSHDVKHLRDIIMQVLQPSKTRFRFDKDDTLHSDWNIPTGNVAYNVSCEA